MNADQAYLFHQTPPELAKRLMEFVPLVAGDRVIEPFRGEGAFWSAFPSWVSKDWAEIRQGRDYRDLSGGYDWVITNPPFRLETNGKRVNSFWALLDYYSQRAEKGICFLANDVCLGTLTPKRHQILSDRGWGITQIVVCSVKKWRGRYFFIVLEKGKPSVFRFLTDNF